MLTEKDYRVDGKIALVLGGAGDIGKAIATSLSAAGAETVIISSRKQENLDKAAAEIKDKSKGKVVGIAGHLGKLETIKALVDAIKKDFGRIDIVVNSSGSSFMVPLTDVEEWQWDNVMNVNVKGPLRLTFMTLSHCHSSTSMRSTMKLEPEELTRISSFTRSLSL